MENICILNTGGTFNKLYNPILGTLEVPKNNEAIQTILNHAFRHQNHISLGGLIYKDSLEFDENDRIHLANTINAQKESKIIVIHGTDTMHLSAKTLETIKTQKTVIFLGAMQPFSIEPLEASCNLALALGFIQSLQSGIYISMQGLILPHNQIEKNYKLGIFCAKN